MDNSEPTLESLPPDDEEEEVKQDEADSDEEEEPKEDDEELILHPKKQDVLKEFPELYKKFPAIEKSVYRDQQFTEVFANPKEAKEAQSKLEEYGKLEEDLFKGSSKSFLELIKSEDKEAFKTLVDNYLPSLMEVDKDAYFHIVGNVARSISAHMLQTGKSSGDKNLEIASAIINKFLGITDGQVNVNFGTPKSEESDKIKEERESFARERLEEKQKDTQDAFVNSLKSTIEENIDPKGQMSEYVKRNAIKEVQEQIEIALEEDEQFGRYLDRLWKKSAENKYPKADLKKIKDASISKARVHMPAILARVRSEALKGIKSNAEVKEKRGPLPAGRTTQDSGLGTKTGQKLPASTRSLDFLMQDN